MAFPLAIVLGKTSIHRKALTIYAVTLIAPKKNIRTWHLSTKSYYLIIGIIRIEF